MILRLNYCRFYLRLCCYSLPSLALVSAVALRLLLGRIVAAPPSNWSVGPYSVVLLVATLAWVIAAEHYNVCSVEELFREHTGIRMAARACAVTYVVVLCSLFFIRGWQFSRTVVVVSALILLLQTLFVHAVFRRLLHVVRRARRPIRILIVGTDAFARRAASRLRRAPLAPCVIAGYVHLPGEEVAVTGAPVYELEDASLIGMPLDDIIIAFPPERLPSITEIAAKLDKLCVPIRAIIDLGNQRRIHDRLFQFGRMQMLDLSLTPAETLDYSIFKRAFDLVFASVVILVSSPVLAAIALAIKITSPGPVLFKQTRVGLNGQLFTMYKFRTMKIDTSSESDTRWTTAEDPRRTGVGQFLRRSSLDELPQFFNVLKGDMSVVGPRPERPHFVRKFLGEIARYNNRHRLKVGITGWAQVNGWRGDTSISKRLECDLFYIENWTFWLDLRIVLRTAWSGLFGKNAY